MKALEDKTQEKKIVNDPIVRRISVLLRERGKTEKDLTDELGLPPGTMSKWKYYGSRVYLYHIEQICNYLDTTPNYLFYGYDMVGQIKELTPIENSIIRLFRTIDDRKKNCVKETLEIFAEK